MRSTARQLLQFLRRRRLNLLGLKLQQTRLLGHKIECRPGMTSNGRGHIECGPGAWIESGVVLHAYGGRIVLGRNIFLGPQVVIYGHGGVEIGDDCLIAMQCRILSSEHEVAPLGVTIHSRPDILKPTRLGNDVWLGAGVTVLGGVTVGDGAIIGAGAVITGDIPPGAIAWGVPAAVRDWRPGAQS